MSTAESPRKPGKRLALFFDGTWDVPQNYTNVWRLYSLVAERDTNGIEQRSFYDEGVGTHWYDRVSGGMFGAGLGNNLRAGYRWLMQHYDEGDEIYLFGFSRGAFTARGLAGLIARCGLLTPDAPMSFWDVFQRYKKIGATNGQAVRPIYELIRLQHDGATNFSYEDRIILEYAQYNEELITMVGVWDTVGSIGLPFGNFPGISSRSLRFYDTNLTKVVKNAYQALALDEHRRPYWGMLWTNFVPNSPPLVPPQADNRTIEQRWFAGAHCNVGGGYCEDLMPQRPLAWIQDNAATCGLAFRMPVVIRNDDDLRDCQPVDSYAQFLLGLWKWVSRPYVRWVLADDVPKTTGYVQTVNERIDRSVFERCRMYPRYRPSSLIEWATRKGYDLEKVINSNADIDQLTQSVKTTGIQPPIRLAAKASGVVAPISDIVPTVSPEKCWEVWRRDDVGNAFLVQGSLTESEADKIVADFESNGHKQVYWKWNAGLQGI